MVTADLSTGNIPAPVSQAPMAAQSTGAAQSVIPSPGIPAQCGCPCGCGSATPCCDSCAKGLPCEGKHHKWEMGAVIAGVIIIIVIIVISTRK